jgi:Fe-S-cluster containining protein
MPWNLQGTRRRESTDGGGETTSDLLKLHIHRSDGDHEVTARYRIGPTKVMELLPLAREISDGITAIVIGQERSEGRNVSCRAGCGACCVQLVPIAPAEAVLLADVVEAMPERQRGTVKARFENAVRRLREMGLIDRRAFPGQAALRSPAPTGKTPWEDVSHRYFDARIPCPFLEDGSCGVYPERPMVCREYNVTTPASLCATLTPDVRAIPRLVRMSEVMRDFTNRLLGRDDYNIPLTLSLDWARVHRDAFDHEGDGEEMAIELVRRIREADESESS